VRLRVAQEELSFTDAVHGERREDVSATVGDFVLRRSDEVPAYQLAVVADDIAMGVTEVVRGDDLLGSTARQLLLYRALGASPPSYAHVPLILGPDGVRLSKRHGAIGVRAFIERVGAARLIGRLAATLGLCDVEAAVMPRDLVVGFSFDRLPRAATVIDPATL
jgi:glutamyl-tRNA synthetase